MGVGARPFGRQIFTDQRLHPFTKGDLVPDLVDQPGRFCSLGGIAAGRGQPADRIRCDLRDLRLWPRLGDIGLPGVENRRVQRGPRLTRRLRRAVAGIGFDEILVGSDLVDVRRDLEAFKQRPEIRLAAARTHYESPAKGIDPALAGMGGQQHPIVDIGRSIGQHRLLRGAHRIHCRADFLQVNQPAAGKFGQIEHHRLDPVIAGCGADRPGDVAGAVFALRIGLGQQQLQRIDLGRLLDHRAVQLDQQRPVADQTCAGPRGQHRIKPGEEQQHEDKDKTVLYPDQKMPDFAGENHALSFNRTDRPRLSSAAGKGHSGSTDAPCPPLSAMRA